MNVPYTVTCSFSKQSLKNHNYHCNPTVAHTNFLLLHVQAHHMTYATTL